MQCLKITPYLLHKEVNEDVLIDSVQGIPLAFIADKDWQTLKSTCSADEFNVFTEHYEDAGDVHVLHGIPAIISAQESLHYDQFEIDLGAFYESKDDGSWHITEDTIPISVMTILQSKGAVSDARKAILSEACVGQMQTLLAQHLDPPKAPALSYVARNDTSNYYFYKKAHEHMPGTMLIEMARQALYHYAYSETGHLRGEVAISMTDLDIDFYSYVESAYTLEILACQSDALLRPLPRVVDKKAIFYQNGRKVAQVKIQGSVMKNRLFKRLRTLHLPESHWFFLSPRISHHVLLTDTHGECKQVPLHQISMSGIQIAEDIDDFECSAAMLYIQGAGFLKLKLSGDKENYDGRLELPFSELTAQQSYQLQDIIKCNGTFHEKRLPHEMNFHSHANDNVAHSHAR